MGKVLGIGAMGLLQFTCWVLVLLALAVFGGTVAGLFLDPVALGLDATVSTQELLSASGITLPPLRLSVLLWFVLFFLGGFFLYAGLFAAVGSMVDQPQEAQSLLPVVMLPLVLPTVLSGTILESPNSTLSVVFSLVPFSSPVQMMVRMAVTDLPLWEVLLSFALLVAGIVGTVWVSSRIYRAGILMHGKKASLRDAIRWLRYAS